MRTALASLLLLFLACSAFAQTTTIYASPETTIAEPAPAGFAVGVGGDTPLLAWTARGSRGYDRVFVAPLGRPGTPVELPVASAAGTIHAITPAIVFGGSSHLVVWVEPSGALQILAGMRLARDGRALDLMPIVLSATSVRTQTEPPLLFRAGSGFAVSWNGNVVEVNGSGALTPIVTGLGAASAAAARGDALIVAENRTVQPVRCSFGFGVICIPAVYALDAQVFRNGGAAPRIGLAQRSGLPWLNVAAAAGSDGFLVVSRDAITIDAVRISPQGVAGGSMPIGSGHRITDLRAAADGALYAIAWIDQDTNTGSELVARILTPRGLSPLLMLAPGSVSSAPLLVPVGGERVMVVYRRADGSRTRLVSRILAEHPRSRPSAR